jgi:putative ABC transport system ATP-binding protein
VLELLRTATDEDGQTTVMVTHDARAAATADRVLLMAGGRVVADLAGPSEQEILDAS